MRVLAFAGLLLVPAAAQAFPVVVAGASGVALGIVAFPLLLLALAAYLLFGAKESKPLVAVGLSAVGLILTIALAHSSGEQESLSRANLFNSAKPAVERQDLPFGFMPVDAQQSSPHGVSPGELLEGIRDGSFAVIRVDMADDALFRDLGIGISVDEAWRQPQALVEKSQGYGRPVVLIDAYGGVAATMAHGLAEHFGENVGFLKGGIAALSDYGWDELEIEADDHALTVDSYQDWLEASDDAFVLSLTTEHEFLTDGWMYGDLTLGLGEFLSGIDELVEMVGDRPILISAFETNDSGATWIAVSLLRERGLDVYYVRPDEEEILFKPAYFAPYKNSDRLLGLADAKRYILHRPDVVFLDFQSKEDWLRTKRKLANTLHIDMEEIAHGGLPAWAAQLDKGKSYVGLAYDRRTAYHSALAGEIISAQGAVWLGRYTLPEVYSDELLKNEDLASTLDEAVLRATHLRSAVGGWVATSIGSPAMLTLMLAVSGVWLTLFLVGPYGAALKVAALLAVVALGDSVTAGAVEYATFELNQTTTLTQYTLLLCLAFPILKRRLTPAFRFRSPGVDRRLPAKAHLLEGARRAGFNVPFSDVVTGESSKPGIASGVAKRKNIVRSAALSESRTSVSSGVYDSLVVETGESIDDAVARVLAQIKEAGEVPFALVQAFVPARAYGVAMFGAGECSHLLTCERSTDDSVTAGRGSPARVEVTLWDVRKAPWLERRVFRALLRLNRAIGATGIEWALTKTGSLMILQVNADPIHGGGIKALASNVTARFHELPTAHPDALSAAIVAACAPVGEQVAVGNRRLSKVHTGVSAWLTLRSDLLSALGAAPYKFAWAFPEAEVISAYSEANADRIRFRAERCIPIEAGSRQLISFIVAELEAARDLYGRFNRIATMAMELRVRREAVSWESRVSDTALGGMRISASVKSGSAQPGHTLAPIVGFDVHATVPSFEHEHLPSSLLYLSDGLLWVKDSCAAMLMAELGDLRPAVAEISARGCADQLLAALGRSIGAWDACASLPPASAPSQAALPLKSFFNSAVQIAGAGVFASGIPADGLTCTLSTPENMEAGDAVLLDDASMENLPHVENACAVVVRSAPALAHLMQHVRRLRLPLVIGGSLPEMDGRARVIINKDGSVSRA